MSNSDFDRYDWMFTSPLAKKERVEGLEETKSSSVRRPCSRKTTKDNRIDKDSSKPVVTCSPEANDGGMEKVKRLSKKNSTSKVQQANPEETRPNRLDKKASPAPSKKRKAILSTNEESSKFVEPDLSAESPKSAKKSCLRNLPEIPTDQVPIFKSSEFVAEASNIIHSSDIIVEFNNENKDKKRYYEDFCRPKAKSHDEEYRKSMNYEGILEVSLEYPGSEVQERHIFVAECIGHRNKDEYKPIDDLLRTVKIIIETMLTQEAAKKFENPNILLKKEKSTKRGNIERRLDRAKNRGNFDDFVNAVDIFNQYLQDEKRKGGFLADHVINPDPYDSEYRQLIHHIVQQVYDRVVAPHVDIIKKGRGKSEDYGELLPPFIDDIIEKTKLNRDSVFFDLGSGVGNVLLQVAAQVGCNVYGVEINDARYQISIRQSKEFLARCRLYGIKSGKVTIAKIDLNSLSKNRELFESFKKASVVLVNNLNFSPELNFLLSNLFLDLPPTSQIVSLLSFGGSVTETKRSDLIAVENVNVVAYQENWTIPNEINIDNGTEIGINLAKG
ncbi:10187_t:CDS:2 [Acaulospora morrowiae]|uniref:Histone-lysine N-methyltransferase, H3 lysine-79 specific n=1 Tax=Acaulospora morrowiae TaxID=94023 RepID=A0A9N9D0N6_9GLOM|nr:10187_t:CDS:2 [Acaulospora morrowiae]